MKKVLFISIIALLSNFYFAQTNITGGLVSGTWQKINSPYLINGSIQIQNGATLTIEPGVDVIFQGAYKINVQGKLIAIGNEQDSIRFFPVDQTTGWRGIRFLQTNQNNDSSFFQYCSLKYSKAAGTWPDDNGGAFCLYDFSKVLISHCEIAHNEASDGGAIFNYNAAPLVLYNNIHHNKANWNGGAIIGPGRYKNNKITYNQGVNCGGLYFFGADTVSNNIIRNNIAQNFGGGFFCGGGIISNNIFSNNQAYNGGAIHVYPGNVLFLNNTIVNNKATVGGAFDMEQGASPNFKNCIIWGNSATTGNQVSLGGEGEDPNFYYCNIQGGLAGIELNGFVYTGNYENNISLNPNFVSESAGAGINFDGTGVDWSLVSSSPCIDAGMIDDANSMLDFNNNFRVNVCKIDMGAIEFQSGIPLQIDISLNQALICHNDQNGEVEVTATGGNGVYEYLWNDGNQNALRTNLEAGIYTVTVKELGNNCEKTDFIVIENPKQKTISLGPSQELICDGNLELEATNEWDTLGVFFQDVALEDICFINDTVGFLVSSNNKIYKTEDYGKTWIAIPNCPMSGIYDVLFLNETVGFVGGSDGGGRIYKTTDGGNTWNLIYSNVSSIFKLDGNLLSGIFACGYNGLLIKSIDQGANWQELNPNTNAELWGLKVINENLIYCTGGGSLILRSTDGGTTWNSLNHPLSSASILFNSVDFYATQNGVVISNLGKILYTQDAGNSWSESINNNMEYFRQVHFISQDEVYISGQNSLKKSNDGGKTWLNLNDWQLSANFNGLFVGQNGDKLLIFNNWSGNHGYVLRQKPLDYISYTWLPDNGLSNPNISNPEVNLVSNQEYFIVAIDQNGCEAKDSILINVNPIQIDLGNNIFFGCGNDTLLVVNSNYIGEKELFYSWFPSLGLNSTTNDSVMAFPVVSTKYYLTLNTLAGCQAIDSIKINVQDLTLNLGSDLTLNCGNSYTFSSVYNNYQGTETLNISWSPIAGISDLNSINPIANPTESTNYTLTISTNNGCEAKDSLYINVNPLTLNIGFDKSIICGSSVELNQAQTNFISNDSLNFLWETNSSLSILDDYITTANPNQTQTYVLQTITSNGCNAKDTIIVHVTPLNLNLGSILSFVCGETVNLPAFNSNYTGIDQLSYAWNPSEKLSETTIAQPIFYSNVSEELILTIETTNACSATDTLFLEMIPLNIQYDNVVMECGTNYQVNSSTNYTGLEPLIYSWNTQSGISDSTIANPQIFPTNPMTYQITASTANNCQATDVFDVSFTAKDAPEICLVGVFDGFNQLVWNKNLYSNVDSFYIYRETNESNIYERIHSQAYDDMSLFIDSSSNPTAQSNKYKLSFLDVCGLESNISLPHKTMHLTINQGIGTTWNLIWEAYEGFTVSTYNIYRGTDPLNMSLIGTTSGSSTQYTDVSAPAGDIFYQVELIAPFPCNPQKIIQNSLSNIATNTENGIETLTPNGIEIYPNPCESKLFVKFPNQYLTMNTSIFTSEGKLIFNKNVQNNQEIDLVELNKGVYFIEVKNETFSIVQRFIKY
ncbi:MAG: YCF48-related protein [Flavobacteriia bacterium]|jgi:photosystem II stability/assembly factor-like uncharacterized protein